MTALPRGGIKTDFLVNVSAGRIDGLSMVRKFGHNLAVGTSLEDLWSEGGAYAYLSVATVLKISSADANDTLAGTGARTVQIYGLDSAHLEIDETIILNGQTEVNSVNTYLRIYRMVIRTAGSGGANASIVYAGTGTVTAGVPAVVYSSIDAGLNQTLGAMYTVPANKTAYLLELQTSSGGQKAVDVYLLVRPINEVFQVKDSFHYFQDSVPSNYKAYLKIEAKSDITIQAMVASTTSPVGSYYSLLLVDDD